MHNETLNSSSMYDAAHAVYKTIKTLPSPIRNLTLRSLNYLKPQNTSWWLVPSQQLPIYMYSKLFFHRLQAYSSRMLTGFSFERGVGRQLTDLVDAALIMQPNWYWRRFLNDVLAGSLLEPIHMIQRQSGDTMLLAIELYGFEHLQRRTLETKVPDDVVIFQVNDDANTLKLHEEATQQLQGINQVTNCRDLALHIEMTPAFSWNWLRFTLGVLINPIPIGNQSERIDNLWRDILSPWMPLLG